ncbi:hypothetical protein ZWY2020_005236 [Hordeum vulgare]|nr:hypothetical protein ZWY2020_005236 [Hordeum vulgare]
MTDDEGQEIPNVGVVPKKAPKVMNWTSPMSAMMLKGLSEVAARGAKTNKGDGRLLFFDPDTTSTTNTQEEAVQVTSSARLLKYNNSSGTPCSGCNSLEYVSVHKLQTHQFTYEELEKSTGDFSDRAESPTTSDRFGTMYKATLELDIIYSCNRRAEELH